MIAFVLNWSVLLLQEGHLTQYLGQIFLDTLKHPHIDDEDIRSEAIVHRLRRFEWQFAETGMHTYNLWNEGDGNQRLDFVVSYSLEVFRKIMRNREWKHKFELTFRPIICSRKAFDRTPVLWLVVGADTQKIATRCCCGRNTALF